MSIRRAILSVSDKTGIVELARFLAGQGVEILSTGGTASHLREAGIEVVPIARWTGSPEILGGRVKTLTPKVFGAILHDRSNPGHIADCEAQGIPPIDLVVVNLYPFESTIAREGVDAREAIEQIDIGGPSMLRAAAKNHEHVLPLCSPGLYAEFIDLATRGEISLAFRRRAAAEVFRTTCAYDAAIAAWLHGLESAEDDAAAFADREILALRKVQDLRYGENPQQKAAFYREVTARADPFLQLQGKEISYNNLLDLDAALRLAGAFSQPACAVIKHTNPCGSATADTPEEALRLAIESDPVSAFGGIIGMNRPFTEAAARQVESMFLEVIVAPSFEPGALAVLSKKKNLRLVTAGPIVFADHEGRTPVTSLAGIVVEPSRLEPVRGAQQGTDHHQAQGETPWPPGRPTFTAHTQREFRSVAGGLLVQSIDRLGSSDSWRCATKMQPTAEQRAALEFAWILCAHVKSNAIVLTRGTQSAGVGAGQMSRVDAARIAVMKSVLPTSGTVAASDAFFPFRDGLDILCDAGVTAVVQPGGSVRDDEVIAAADERGVVMMLTGERHFRH